MTGPDRGEPWQARAQCRGLGPLFFPEGDTTRATAQQRYAARFCTGCPVTRQCLQLAMDAEGGAAVGSRYGVFGGLSPAQRRALYERRIDRRNATQLAHRQQGDQT